ncbi:MAG TPA: hypothetical protein VMB83_06660 [Roseiarcus sp.]|nr:hypothetical protein [Roseiarcus sp.]
MRDLADRGRAIVMISSDLPEIVGMSDRIVVMRQGEVAGELEGGATEEEVMALAVDHGRRRAFNDRSRRPSSTDDGPSRASCADNAPVGSIALYVGVALWTGQTKMLETEGLVGLMQRMVALGIR